MNPEPSFRRRELRTAWFIAAVMVAALLYFASQGGLLKELLPSETDSIATAQVDRSDIYRRTVSLPLSVIHQPDAEVETQLRTLLRRGINWIELRIPLWVPYPKRIEYDRYDLDNVKRIAQLADKTGFGVTIAPVFWDGEQFSYTPHHEIASSFFSSYREMLLDCASIAASSGVDVLLFDALFASPSVSAAEWVQLITELREAYAGMLEARMDEDETPLAYLRQIDGAHVSADTASVNRVLREDSASHVFLRMVESDEYYATLEEWKPLLNNAVDNVDATKVLLSLASNAHSLSGFTLQGYNTYSELIAGKEGATGIARLLLQLRNSQLRKELASQQHELNTGTAD